MERIQRVAVVGLGKLGASMAAAIAARGVEVIGVDVDPRKVDAVNQKVPPVYEPGLADMMKKAGDRLSATTDLYEAVRRSDATFIVVATPSQADGHFSLEYVLSAAQTIGQALKAKNEWHIVVITSTVSPLSMDERIRPYLEAVSQKQAGKDFGLAYNPEFIALGSVLRDFLNPDLVLIGESDKRTGDLLEDFYRRVVENNPAFARMNFINAELTKLSINTFVTTKITFANMLARLCERLPGADVDVVTAALGRDSRIGGRYLKGAISYGGPCFPRDNLALIAVARQVGTAAEVAESTDHLNRELNRWLATLVAYHRPPNGQIGILGLAYKPGSDVVEESPGLHLAQYLAEQGLPVIAYDPAAQANAQRLLGRRVEWAPSALACVERADIIVVTTPWPEFREIPAEIWQRPSSPRKIIDCWRFLPELATLAYVTYIPLGKGGIPVPQPLSMPS
ncbi:MAG: nucleotide sugar dehydrogenase [Bacteroidia bacterium]|nr:nucleotide sugar dehydrogenase [Bacteroidia bacterium]MDW8089339.1 nucleotide sugar dehydrogenase [Bacteroidia bacterium]